MAAVCLTSMTTFPDQLVANLSELYNPSNGDHASQLGPVSDQNLFGIRDSGFSPYVNFLSAAYTGSSSGGGPNDACDVDAAWYIGASEQSASISVLSQSVANPTIPSSISASSSASVSSGKPTANVGLWCHGRGGASDERLTVVGVFTYPPGGAMPAANFGGVQ